MGRNFLFGLAMTGLMMAALPALADDKPPAVTADDMVQGSDKAPVTVIEYASLDCPHCARFETGVFPQIKKELIDTGKIRYVFRDFPLHKQALMASQLAHCEPARFWGFIDVLFESQATWFNTADTELPKIAKLGGIGDTQYQACLADKAAELKIVDSRKGGEAAGVDSTPTFFVNGTKHAGEITYDDFAKLVHDAGA